MAEKVNLYIDQGSNAAIQIDVKAANGSPIDLTEYTIVSQIRKHHESVNAISFQCTGHSNGTLVLELTAEQTANIEAGRHYYDVVMIDTEDSVVRIQEGLVTFNFGITRL